MIESMLRRALTFVVLFPAAAAAFGQSTPEAAPAPAPTPAATVGGMLDTLGALVKDGHIDVEADLLAGSVPAIPKYTLEVEGTPRTSVTAEAVDGVITKMHFGVDHGRLIVRGRGLRPKVSIESLEFESPKGITDLKFKGLGIWRPIVAIFGGIARSAVRKLELRTDVPSVLKGEILGGKKPAATPAAAPAPTPVPSEAPATGAPPAPTTGFTDLVREVRINRITLTAFPDRPMALRPFIAFRTAAHPESGDAVRIDIEKGVLRPGRDGAANYVEFSGHLDGEIQDGEMQFEQNTCVVSKGRLKGGAYQAKTGEDGKLVTAFSADSLFFALASGKFVVPGGMGVEVDQGSTFEVDQVKVTSAGRFSGVAKLDLAGKTGALSRKGATISASNIHVRTPGLTVVDGKATGPLELAFDYQLDYPFVVKYPIEQIAEKKLMLDFHGPFAATLALKDAGGDEGEVTGTYVFKAPWDPIEQAALVALAAKWQQDLAIKNIDFAIVPKQFRPCGETCFTLSIEITAEKRSQNRLKKLFSQYCAPIASANLVVDKEARAFILKDVKVETHCKGVVGFFINFLTPFLTKTYSEMKLFQMPPGLPLTIDSVRGGAHVVEIGGRIDWEAGGPKPEVPPAPQPVVVEPGTW
jgi:hypothetical protein